MGETLARRLQQTRFDGPHHELMLAVMVANSTIEGLLDEAFAGQGLTQPQYNVLRILNSVHPGAHSRGEIARRMVRRAPDLTRMIDRLVRLGYVERQRGEHDQRQSLARITKQGRQALEKLEPALDQVRAQLARRLSAEDARNLVLLLEKLFASLD
jgi:DNA-binding MarR family transcriptional regulator